jgi:hypothetical protein
MQGVLTVELTLYLITALCAVVLLPKSFNWRFRLLIGTIGLQCLAHAASALLNHHPFWQSRLGHMSGVIEMFGGALALTAAYLLKRENRDRLSTDARIRLAESVVQPPGVRTANSKPYSTNANPMPRKAALELEAPERSIETISKAPWNESIKHSRLRRKGRRYPLSSEVEVTVLGHQGFKCPGECLDISRGGARLRVPGAIREGTQVKVEFGDSLFLGQVRYCETGEHDFCVGVQFEQSLDLRRLAEILRNFPDGKTSSQ